MAAQFNMISQPVSVAAQPINVASQALVGQPTSAAQGRLDWLGVLCSFGCAVHCAAMPVLVASLPSLTNLRWLADPLFHQVVAVMCGVLVARAIVPGYRKHRNSRVVTLAGFGIGLLFVAAFILPDTCCSEAGKGFSKEGIVKAGTEISQGPKIVLVSSNNANAASKLGYFDNQDDSVSESCESRTCSHASQLSRTLLTATELEGQLGANAARALTQAQPFLSPIGGLFLIVAHIMNIRLRCCRRSKIRQLYSQCFDRNLEADGTNGPILLNRPND